MDPRKLIERISPHVQDTSSCFLTCAEYNADHAGWLAGPAQGTYGVRRGIRSHKENMKSSSELEGIQ